MRKLRLFIVSAVVGLGVFGFPTHVVARSAPKALDHRSLLADVVQPGERVDLTHSLPWRANLVGVSFLSSDAEASGVEILLRARDGRDWTPWYDLHVDPDEQPDAREMRDADPRVATLPQWVGTAKRFELAIELDDDASAVRDVRLEAINTNGDAVEMNPVVAAVRSIGRFLTATAPAATRAEAAASQPRIISRAEWGADESLRSKGPGIADRLVMAHIHHTVNSNSYSKSESAALVRGIYRYHTKNRDYSDIGYNFLVDRYGQIFEGRHGGIERAVIGGHAAGFNTESTGIALIGTFSSSSPPSAMVSSLKKLLAWKFDVHHVKPVGKVLRISGGSSRYDAGKKVWVHRISGHRDTSSTSCPGSRTYNLLPSIRDAVDKIGHPKIYGPALSHEDLTLTGIDRDGPLEATASFSRTVAWRFEVTNGAGDVVFKKSGTGRSMSVEWNGRKAGEFVPTGRYTARITASNTAGSARPFAETVDIFSDWSPPFWDEDGSQFEEDIHAIFDAGLTYGCGEDRFCPLRRLTRAEMAAFISRAMELPASPTNFFIDDNDSIHEDDINAIAEAGITTGCSETEFCPDRLLTRAEMAAFLARALELPPAVLDHFDDDDGHQHEADINRIAEAGITYGCGSDRFCPGRLMTRQEMAAFLNRAFLSSPGP